jgi:DNA invertase Pin-like site-specific DNA recombinase
MFNIFGNFINNIKKSVSDNISRHSNQDNTNLTTESDKINPFSNIGRNCIIYVRVSSEEQNLEAQQYACEEFCFNNRLFIREIITEKCTGYNENSQKGLNKIIEENENINIVVFSVDRFSRNINKANKLINNMALKNINLISVKDNISLSTAFGRYEFRKLMTASQYESELISERVKNSIKYRKAKGFHIGNTPYGYTLFNKKLAKDNNEQKIIRFILTTIKKQTTPEKLKKILLKLMQDLHMDTSNFGNIIITYEDEHHEYREFRQDENFTPTYGSIANLLNDYGVLKRNKYWSVSSISNIVKKQITNNERDMQRLRM